mmetsp:Transcript_841/g.2117  ORF Transcript_841/g.2117 Transcript_841/m.2117 type:complete len:204 (-) Transcript_841:749-1360(-)
MAGLRAAGARAELFAAAPTMGSRVRCAARRCCGARPPRDSMLWRACPRLCIAGQCRRRRWGQAADALPQRFGARSQPGRGSDLLASGPSHPRPGGSRPRSGCSRGPRPRRSTGFAIAVANQVLIHGGSERARKGSWHRGPCHSKPGSAGHLCRARRCGASPGCGSISSSSSDLRDGGGACQRARDYHAKLGPEPDASRTPGYV